MTLPQTDALPVFIRRPRRPLDIANALAETSPGVHVDCRAIAPDDWLRTMAAGSPDFDIGEIAPDMAADIAMRLPDIAAELLARRAAQDVACARATRGCP